MSCGASIMFSTPLLPVSISFDTTSSSVSSSTTSLAISFSFLVGGAPLIESIFAYPGVGYYLNTAIGVRDIPLMQGMFFVIICTVIFTNFLVEILYGFYDPRLRRKK